MFPASPAPSRPSNGIRAVVFDHDGTLINSLGVVVAASNATLAEAGLAAKPRAEIVAGMVLPTPERLGALAGTTDPERMQALAQRFDALVLALAHEAEAYPGIPELLRILQDRGLPLAVVSNSAHAFLEAALGRSGLRSSFQAIVGADDMDRPKPDPGGLLGVLRQFACPPDQALYVGDSRTDLDTARRAGVRAAGVTWGAHGRADLEPLGFDLLVDTPSQLSAWLET